jgi:chromosome segregation ATPase
MSQNPKKMTKKELSREVNALKADVASLKAELGKLRTEQKVKLKEELENLHKKMHAEMEAVKAGSGVKRGEKKIKGKVQAFGHKATKAKDEAKAAIEARVTSIRSEPRNVVTNVDQPQMSKPNK